MWTHPTAHGFAGGLAVGLAVGMILIPFQMAAVAVICCFLRFHIPVSVVAVWISNPATWVPVWVFEGWVGAWLFRISGIDLTEVTNLGEAATEVVQVYTGAIFCALAVIAIGYPIGLWFGTRLVAKRAERLESKLERAWKRAAARAEMESAISAGE